MNLNWDPQTWQRSLRFLLGVITIWPFIYIALFVGLALSGVLLAAMFGQKTQPSRRHLDLIQLQKKIESGEIKELRFTQDEIAAVDRDGRNFYSYVESDSSREEIISQARRTGPDGVPRVATIEENSSRPRTTPLIPFGILVFFTVHILTILLIFLLMPVYIILPLKNDRLDQNMRIVWVVLSCTVGMLSHPVYWYLYIWRKPPAHSLAGGQVTA